MLTDAAVRQARAADAPRKVTDAQGLYLHVARSGKKTFRYDFRYLGRRQTLVLGAYPEVALKQARTKHFEARQQLASGINPAASKQEVKRAAITAADNTFCAVAQEWYEELAPHRSRSWQLAIGGWLKNHIYPVLGAQPLDLVTPADVLSLVRKLAKAGTPRAAEGVRWLISRVYSHAIRNLKTKQNPAREIRGAVPSPPTKHHPTLKPAQLPAFLQKVYSYGGQPGTPYALRILVLTFVRKIELVGAEWTEFDLEAKQWRIPATRLKNDQEHIVPLSKQVIRTLSELRPLTGNSKYLFPAMGKPRKHMSVATLTSAFRLMGYLGVLSPHGIRGTASTILNEQGFRPDVIERQLAHLEPNKVRAAYNHAQYLPERAELMQHWADYLDGMRTGAKVVNLRSNRRRA